MPRFKTRRLVTVGLYVLQLEEIRRLKQISLSTKFKTVTNILFVVQNCHPSGASNDLLDINHIMKSDPSPENEDFPF